MAANTLDVRLLMHLMLLAGPVLSAVVAWVLILGAVPKLIRRVRSSPPRTPWH